MLRRDAGAGTDRAILAGLYPMDLILLVTLLGIHDVLAREMMRPSFDYYASLIVGVTERIQDAHGAALKGIAYADRLHAPGPLQVEYPASWVSRRPAGSQDCCSNLSESP